MYQITYDLIKSFKPCYKPEEIGITQGYSATIPEFIKEYRDKVHNKSDILWTLCRNELMTDKELRLFAVWCARQVQHLMKDERSIKALDVAERYANGEATEEELDAARDAAYAVAWDARYAARDAARDAAWSAVYAAARDAQIDKLLEILEGKNDYNNL